MNKQERYYMWAWLIYRASKKWPAVYQPIYARTKFGPYFWGGILPEKKSELQAMAGALINDPPK